MQNIKYMYQYLKAIDLQQTNFQCRLYCVYRTFEKDYLLM